MYLKLLLKYLMYSKRLTRGIPATITAAKTAFQDDNLEKTAS